MKYFCYLLLSFLLLSALDTSAQRPDIKPMLKRGWRQINAKEPDSAMQLADSILQLVGTEYSDDRVRAMNIKAKALYQKGKNTESVTILFDALRLCKAPRDNKNIAYLYGEIGYAYYAQKHYPESKLYYHKQIDILKSLYGSDSLADPYINLATMQQGIGEFDSAALSLNVVAGIVAHNNNLQQHGYYYLNRGTLYLYTNKLDSAAIYYNKAYDAWYAIGYESQIYKTTFNLGYIAEQQKDYRKAIEYYHRTEQSVKKFGLKSEIAHVAGTIAEAYAAIGKYDSAYKYLFDYVMVNDSVTHDEFNSYLAKLDKQYQSEKNKETIHKQQLELQRQNNRILIFIIILTVVVLGSIVLFGYFTFSRRLQQQVDEAKGKFFANVVHEIRTPLSMIQGPIKVLQEKTTDPEVRYQLDMADRNTTRLNDLVNQMLAISKIDATQYTLSESLGTPTVFVASIVDSFKLQAKEKGITIHFEIGPDENALFDKDAVEKIITNLLSNAIKYTPKGGNVGVEIEKSNTEWTFTIWDTGPGISQLDQEKVFSRFYRTEQHQHDGSKGIGIGLALVKELVLLMNGYIKLDSEPGKGAVFTVTLPLRTPENVIATPSNEDSATILLVEDDADILDFNKTLLLNSGYRVLTARNGIEASTLLLEELPDLIISDVMMPEKDGLTLLKELRNNIATDHIPVILLSAKSSTQAKMDGITEGAQAYLAKPFIPTELTTMVKNQLELLQRQKLRLHVPDTSTAPVADISIEERFADADPFTRRCFEIIVEHLDDAQLSVEMLAGLMNINRSHFQRKIKTLSGYSPSELIKTVRLEKALKMLLKKEGNITEIAYATGFTSQSYFTKCFSDHFGYPPSQAGSIN
ncbi:hypothetical protein CJD36_004995 [Flavipsychrobacter stenotrophus]|uniref:histidine kinase n=1 Tax=Flavipsychrobacter stenotrophus TaxID=2077091 RepID=A0A2S7T2J6_9BACT|nr:ATP-binding protein [Flavipsychrobacter stenotrophus]PQJ13101.1 hypothetical protein CJD36_004995 [Flavipsychrobacter stenotrophus]